MFNINDKVIVISEGFHKDKTGIVKMVYPAPLMDNETVYTIKYDNSNNSGMFKHSELNIV